MKKVLLFLAASMVAVGAMAQLKVLSNGKVVLGNVSNPTANLHMKCYNQIMDPTISGTSALHFIVGNNDPRIEPSNKVVFYKIGNQSGYANIECGTLTQSSDSSLKMNINKIEGDVLSKIKKIDGYTYNWKDDKDGQLQVGFIAQEVEKVFPELVSTVDSSNVKLMSYIGMIPYLLEAIKAQQVQIEDLKAQIGESSFGELKSYQIIDDETDASETASLSQNKPNPFTASTKIEMYVPSNVSNAMLYVYDLQGKQEKAIVVSGRGATSETILGNELQAGLYIYSLVTDGKLVGSKQMILTE